MRLVIPARDRVSLITTGLLNSQLRGQHMGKFAFSHLFRGTAK